MKRNLLFFFLSFICMISYSSEQAVSFIKNGKDTILIGLAMDLPPFQFINEKGASSGYETELMKTILDNAGICYKETLDSWENIKDRFHNNEIDMITGNISEKNSSDYIMSDPYSVFSSVMVFREGERFDCLSDLKNKKIVYVKSSRIEDITDIYSISPNIIAVNKLYDGLRIIVSGVADAMICSESTVLNIIDRYQLKGVAYKKIDEIEPRGIHFFVSSGNSYLLNDLNASLEKVKNEETEETIRKKWFNIGKINSLSREEQRVVYIIIFCISLLFITIVYMGLKLYSKNKEIRGMYHKLSLAIDSNNLIIWLYDNRSKRFRLLHGYTPFFRNNISLDAVVDMVSERHRAKLFNLIEELCSLSVKKATISFPLFCKDKKIYGEFNLISIVKDGKLDHIVGTFKDVTQKYERDMELFNAKSKLEEYKFRLEKSIAKSDVMMIEFNNQTHKIKFFNNPLISENTLVTPSYFEEFIHPDDFTTFLSVFENMDKGDVSIPSIEYRIKYVKDDNEYNYKSIQMKPFEMKKDGQIIGYVGVVSDITRWKKEIDKLGLSEKDFIYSNPAFLANMSHEIRTPLNAIVGFSELVPDAESAEERSMFIDSIKSNSNQLLNLISDLLDLSKIEKGSLNYTYTEFSANEICARLYKEHYQNCCADVTMVLNTNKEDIRICSDYDRIKQVLDNLTSNAVKYTEKGIISISFESAGNDSVKFIIEDTGIGIPADQKDFVFDKFTRFNAPNESSGLSLSITKNIVESLGGRIGVDSELDKGSTFWFTIPCNPDKDAVISESLSSEEKEII